MSKRINYAKASPEVFKALMNLNRTVVDSGLEKSLLTLVSIRVSQLNGCDFCIALHMREARAYGESAERLQALSYWRDSASFSARQQAALAWADSLTLVAETHVPDKVYEQATIHFTEKELADLTLAITMVNAWNRFGVGFRIPVSETL